MPVKVRYRIDGMLYDILSASPEDAVGARVAHQDHGQAEHRRKAASPGRPDRGQDRGPELDIRVSTIPTAFGERVVLRLLDKTGTILDLSDLGMDAGRIGDLQRLIKSPYGIVLVTGPTGSGKTTTLYAALTSINSPKSTSSPSRTRSSIRSRGSGRSRSIRRST